MSRPGDVNPEMRAAALEAFFRERPEPSMTYVEADRRLTVVLSETMGMMRDRAGLSEPPADFPTA